MLVLSLLPLPGTTFFPEVCVWETRHSLAMQKGESGIGTAFLPFALIKKSLACPCLPSILYLLTHLRGAAKKLQQQLKRSSSVLVSLEWLRALLGNQMGLHPFSVICHPVTSEEFLNCLGLLLPYLWRNSRSEVDKLLGIEPRAPEVEQWRPLFLLFYLGCFHTYWALGRRWYHDALILFLSALQ